MTKFDVQIHCEEVYTINLEEIDMDSTLYQTVEDFILDYAITCSELAQMGEHRDIPTPAGYVDMVLENYDVDRKELIVGFLSKMSYTQTQIQDYLEWATREFNVSWK